MDLTITVKVKMIDETHGNLSVHPDPQMEPEEVAMYLEWAAGQVRRGKRIKRVK